MWAGVDVGDRRKGFHAVAIDDRRIAAGPHCGSAEATAEWLTHIGPLLTAIDSPISAAPAGYALREGERLLHQAVCGIRWTPDLVRLREKPGFYGWVLHGLELYEALLRADLPVIECFPTASWTRWVGARGSRTRARWTCEALPGLELLDVPERTNQDVRDAIAAALTARLHTAGQTEAYGEIVVPLQFQGSV